MVDAPAAARPAPRLLAQLAERSELLVSWPQLQELRAAADSKPSGCHNRRLHAATSLAACARAEMTAALIAQRTRGPGTQLRAELDAAVVVLCGQLRHEALLSLSDGGLRILATSWHLPERDVLVVESCLRTVIGPPAIFGAASLPTPSYPLVLGPESRRSRAGRAPAVARRGRPRVRMSDLGRCRGAPRRTL